MPDTHIPNDPLTRFTSAPAPRRHDGWTVARQRLFVRGLAETGCVAEAAAEAGMSARSAYRLRGRVGAEAFAEAWDKALVAASQRLVSVAFERALLGTPRDVWYRGEKVGVERRPNDRLLACLLKHLDPARFGALATLAADDFADPRAGAEQEVKRLVHHFADAPADDAEDALAAR